MKKIISIMIVMIIFVSICLSCTNVFAIDFDCIVDLTNMKTITNGIESSIKVYKQSEFYEFATDYNNGNLPQIYVTEFLCDGVGMVKSPDLDDFIDGTSNNIEVKNLDIKVININRTGNVTLTGELTGGMIAVNTNWIPGDLNIILNGVKIDTDTKKAPAIYVYNKDINYTEHKVTIKTLAGTENYIEGGKLKKVSLVGSDELTSYSNYYTGDAKTNYLKYTNYYGIYTKEQANNVWFAKVQADNEDLQDGDPYYFYKAAGAISSDIDLYFEGQGSLSVISKNGEGIETKGNLVMQGGTGNYYIEANDDCLNTTTASNENSNVRNELLINVKSLIAKVNLDADEGDCIDSNGTITISGGTIFAFAHPTSQDDGLDSNKGTYINGGTVVAIGNMSDEISNSSTQDFIKLNFATRQDAGTLVCITDKSNNPIIAFKSDRTFTTLTISSPALTKQTYYVYKGGNIEGEETEGLYTSITSYTNGIQQQGIVGNMMVRGGQDRNLPNINQNNTKPDVNTIRNGNNVQGTITAPNIENENNNIKQENEMAREITAPDFNKNENTIPGGNIPPEMNQNGNTIPGGNVPPEMNQNGNTIPGGNVPPEMNQNGNTIPGGNLPPEMNQNGNTIPGGNLPPEMNQNGNNLNQTDSSIEFTLTSENHTFTNITDYNVSSNTINNQEQNETNFNLNVFLPIIIIFAIFVLIIIIIIVLVIVKKKSKKI